MNNNNFDNEHYDYRTYGDYIKLKDVNTKPFLMISELIDNSISSFDNKYGSNDWKETLNISIKFVMFKKIDNDFDREIIDGIEVSKNSYIEFIDNGFGMSRKRLYTAIKLNSINNNTKSKMNVHGRGLKQCAFYFGTDLNIFTNNMEEKSEIELCLSKQINGLNSQIYFDSKDSLFKDRGTKINISKIYTSRILTKKNVATIKDALSHRYSELIKQKLISINLIFSNNNEEIINEFITESNNNIASISDDFGDTKKEDIEKIISKSKEILRSKIRKNNGSINDKDIAWKTFDEISNILMHVEIDTSYEFKWQQIIPYNDSQNIVVDFWLLPWHKANYRGFEIFEGNRAIMHPPINSDCSTYLDPLPRTFRTGSTDNRFAGKFFIDNLDIKTKTDKSTIDMPSAEKEQLDANLRTVWEVFDIFILSGRKRDIDPGKNVNSDDMYKLKMSFISAYNEKNISFIEDYKKENCVTAVNYKINNIEWTIEIYVDNSPLPNQMFESIIHDDDSLYEMTVYTAHSFWKEMDQYNNFFSASLVPIVLLLSIQELKLRDKYNDNIKSIEQINEIGKDILK